MAAATLSIIAVFGLLIGSFLNAAIYRLPRECLSVIKQTRSCCPRCGVQLAWFDNIPLFSFLVLLRGRCRACRQAISWRYPIIECLTAVAFVGLALHDVGLQGLAERVQWDRAWSCWLVHVTIACALIVLSVVDLDFGILPDALTVSGIVLAPILVTLVPHVMPRHVIELPDSSIRLQALANSLIGSLSAGGVLWSVGWLGEIAFRKPAMGLGDVKMFAAMGGFLGLWFILALVIASFAGAVIGLVILAVARNHYIRFGPFLALGMMITALWGPEVFDWLVRKLAT